ncbi:4-hydroxythreonine-4-phosphate dehydrogenase PdxA [Pseudonocardia sp. Ae150A_Ps1]|uniref:4-hydroxythreonine-4-phosphate dehydrogenase PdxA n=1 Tax=Pseudonocardia sp. Ae150A_Ps1 TaxID=1885028 RepID=UPI00094A9D97|nr:4-hydroxythreonine-4-phosphate dehydrogenase PdxA [Pseudonocardia sp. Ae150A_Ps1]
MTATPVLVLADDLSGAAETAAVLAVPGEPATILLAPGADLPATGLTVVDLHCRTAAPAVAADRTRRVLDAAPAGTRTFLKIDSLLRGNVAAGIGALAGRGPVVVAAALPGAGRTVSSGVVHLDGVPLHRTDAWRMEPHPAPDDLHVATGRPDAVVLGVAELRRDPHAALAAALARGPVVLCDADTDDDLDLVAAAATAAGVATAGSGGFAAALGPATGRPGLGTGDAPDGAPRPVLAVVGSAEPVAARQVARLLDDGAVEIRLRPGDPVPDGPAGPGVTVLRPDPDLRGDPAAVAGALSRAATALAGGPDGPHLVLTGGETARRVLDALGTDRLVPLGQVAHGAVRSAAAGGRQVVTRPGSFGDDDSLAAMATAVAPPTGPTQDPPHRTERSEGSRMTATVSPQVPAGAGAPLPTVAVTMGDAAGIGPEVIVPALVHPDVLGRCRPVVIGDADRLRRAATVLGHPAEIVAVDDVESAAPGPDRVCVLQVGELPADLPWGTVSAAAGEGAYRYVEAAAALAVAGRVQAICTAPLNKEALHAAGHRFPGHTELLAHLTGTEEVSMMLSTPTVKVVHVTTHIGLIDAVARIEPGLVERTVRRGHEALVRSGVEAPRIGVCGINPHAGENGLFGYGEEAEKIVPALEVLRADGIDARGPLPADTAFFLAGRGDYDLIVAMYHDQGHGPVKVLGIENGVNLTVGLPVIRTSVDHGTAFDIAGTGKADAGSMVEALRQAVELAARPVA